MRVSECTIECVRGCEQASACGIPLSSLENAFSRVWCVSVLDCVWCGSDHEDECMMCACVVCECSVCGVWVTMRMSPWLPMFPCSLSSEAEHDGRDYNVLECCTDAMPCVVTLLLVRCWLGKQSAMTRLVTAARGSIGVGDRDLPTPWLQHGSREGRKRSHMGRATLGTGSCGTSRR